MPDRRPIPEVLMVSIYINDVSFDSTAGHTACSGGEQHDRQVT
jgi:hypothetical protein